MDSSLRVALIRGVGPTDQLTVTIKDGTVSYSTLTLCSLTKKEVPHNRLCALANIPPTSSLPCRPPLNKCLILVCGLVV